MLTVPLNARQCLTCLSPHATQLALLIQQCRDLIQRFTLHVNTFMFRISKLVIFLSAEQPVVTSDFNLLIDEQPVDFVIDQQKLIVTQEIAMGIHVLILKSLTDKKIEITDVQLDSASVRYGLYLSYLQDNDNIVQPCTAVWAKNQTWILPFANPISFWIECMLNRVPQNLYGQDLQKKYNIHYPSQKLHLPENFPVCVRDFFQFDFDFVVRPTGQHNLRNQAVIPLNLDLSQVQNIVDEYLNIESTIVDKNLMSYNQSSGQGIYNALEDPDWNPAGWFYVSYYGYNNKNKTFNYHVDPEICPKLWQQIAAWDIQDYVSVHIICLEPGGYAAPHKDILVCNDIITSDYSGCCQVYIPLDYPDNNYIKLAGVGILDTSVANVFDYTNVTHCAVNNSDRRRFVLIMRCNIEKNQHLVDQTFLNQLEKNS